MATLSAKKIADALKKAQNVGQAEEPVTINGCSIVLRSLRPDEYEAINTDIDEIPEGIGYLNAFKREHIARSVVEVNDVDLRTIEFVEVDVEDTDPKTHKATIKTVQVEKHVFVRDFVLGSWSREAIDILFRKFNDVVAKAEKIAGEGVVFNTPDETAEDKYRRLLSEAKELEGGMPVDITMKVRSELGFLVKGPAEDYKAAEETLAKLAEEAPPEPTPAPQATPPAQAAPSAPQEAPQRRPVFKPAPQPAPSAPEAPAEPQVPLARTGRPVIPGYTPQTPDELMQARQPLNQQAVDVPVPAPAQVPTPGGPPAHLQNAPVLPPTPAALRRAAEIAAMEGEMAQGGQPQPAVQGGTQFGGVEPAELSRPQPKLNPADAERIFEQPPTAGINPRFRPPNRL